MYKKLVLTLPLIVYMFLLIWPDSIKNIENAKFPIVLIGPYHVRITEIYFWILLLIYGLKLLTQALKKIISYRLRIRDDNCHEKKRRIIGPLLGGENQGRVVTFLLIMMMAVSLIRGIMNNNPLISLDLRGLSYGLMIPLFLSATRSTVELARQISKIYWVLTILAVLCFISIISKSENSAFQSNNLALILILYLACLSIAYILVGKQTPFIHIAIFILAIATSLISLAKYILLGVTLIILISSLYVILLNKRKEIRLLSIYAILALTITFTYLSGGLDVLTRNSSVYSGNSSFSEYYENRIKRADVRDVSGGRFEMWGFLVNEGKKNLIFGSGLGTKNEIVNYYSDQNLDFRGEHNLFVYIFIRWGIIGLAIIIYMLQRIMRLWIKRIRTATCPDNKTLLLAHLLFLIIFLAINTVGLYFNYFETAICFWFCIAVFLAVSRDPQTLATRRNRVQHGIHHIARDQGSP